MFLIQKTVTKVKKIKKINKICFLLGYDMEKDSLLEEYIFKIICTASFENDKMYFNIIFQDLKKEIETIKYEIDWIKCSNIEDSFLTILCTDIAYYISSVNPDYMNIYYNDNDNDNDNVENINPSLLGILSKIKDKSFLDFKEEYYGDLFNIEKPTSIKFEDLITKPSYLLIKMKLKNIILTELELYIETLIKNKECPVLLEQLKLGDLCIPSCKHILSKKAYNNIQTSSCEENGVFKGMFKLCPMCRSKLDSCLLF